MLKRGTWYESIVSDIARLLYPGAVVRVRQHIEGPDGKREVDVEVRCTTDGREEFTLLECKDWKMPVDAPAMDGLHSKSLDLKPDVTIIYSNSGFTRMALDKARRLGLGAMSAMKAGDERIHYVVKRLFVAKVLLVDRFELTVFPADASAASLPSQWEPREVFYRGLPVVNYLAARSRDLLQQHQDAKDIVWTAALLNETEFTISGQAVTLRGIQWALSCSQKYVSQVVQEAVTAGAFDHVRRRAIIPSGQTYSIGSFDREAWQDYSGAPDEAEELPPNTFSVSMLLFKHIPPIAGAGVPAITELLNPTEQEIEVR